MQNDPYYPLVLEPLVREVVWGGRWLAEKLGRGGAEGARLGESWEAYAGSVIGNGAWKGQTLGEAFAREGVAFAGSAAAAYPRFPLLVKFIDAHENLSIQVHPDDDLARQLENYPYGKTEFWYVLDAMPDAHIYYGLNAPAIARQDLQAALENQDLLRYLNRVPVRAGDIVYMPAGTIHALTAGVVVYELQQDSDITYRLYDWGRVGREIHLEKGLQAIDSRCANMEITQAVFTEQAGNESASLVDCGFFQSQLWRVPHTLPATASAESFMLLTVISGSGVLESPRHQFTPLCLETGGTVCVPAGMEFALRNDAQSRENALEIITGQVTQP